MTGKLRNYLYLLSLSPSFAVIYGNLQGGVFTLLNFFYSLIFLGLIEWIAPPLISNNQSAKKSLMPKIVLFLHVPFQIFSLFSLAYGLFIHSISGLWIFAAALSTGLNSGSSAIVVAHELIHCKNKVEQWLGKFLLFTAGNIYFFVEHLRVHHKWVGTQKDNATAKFDEGLYHFFIRSAFGQIKGAYSLEKQRLIQINKNPFSLKNYVVGQIILQGILILILFFTLGIWGILAYITQCLFANFLLEYVNYIQHYGLTRTETQRPTEHHSWDSDQFASRFVLVDISRHADHHYYAGKPFHNLVYYETSPKLPSGYSGLFFIAAIPPLWKIIINARLKEYTGKLGLAG